jgi:hypothetical protein
LYINYIWNIVNNVYKKNYEFKKIIIVN